jgi:regulator of cell morphogenesis and NO signaling
MKIEELTLSNIVTEKPEAAALFEKYNLDYCCRGKQKLSDAVTDPEKLNSILNVLTLIYSEQVQPEIDFNKLSLTKLVDYILTIHHAYVKDSIPLIRMHLDKVATKHGDKYPHMLKIRSLFNTVAIELENHMMKEELILFPRIKTMENKINNGDSVIDFSVETPILVMEREHESAGDICAEIRQLSNNYTPAEDACTTHRVCIEELKMFENDLHRHVHLENNILFPKAIEKERSFKSI